MDDNNMKDVDAAVPATQDSQAGSVQDQAFRHYITYENEPAILKIQKERLLKAQSGNGEPDAEGSSNAKRSKAKEAMLTAAGFLAGTYMAVRALFPMDAYAQEMEKGSDSTKTGTELIDGKTLSKQEAIDFLMKGNTYTPDQLQALKFVLGNDASTEKKEDAIKDSKAKEPAGSEISSSTIRAPTLYFNPRMGSNSLLGDYGMGLFSDDKIELDLSKHVRAGDYGNYLHYNNTPVLRDVLAVNFRGNYAIKDMFGNSTLSIGVKYHTLLYKDDQYQREAELFSKLVMGKNGRADIIGLKIVSDGSDATKILKVGGFYGYSRPDFNIGGGIDVKLKEGIEEIYVGADYLASRNLLLSGMIEKNFQTSEQLSSERMSFKVTYAGRTYAIGSQFGFEHVTQNLAMWKDAGANGNNLHMELFFAKKIARGIVIEPYVAIDNFKPQPYEERPTSYSFGFKLRLDFSEQKKIFGSGQGHGSRDEKQERLSTTELGNSANDTYQKMQIAKARMAALTGGTGAHGYGKARDGGAFANRQASRLYAR